MVQRLMNMFFNEAVKRMVGAFEARANALYADKKITAH
jgi:ribosome-associated toxin RatA of RatAB toxin-antitoxin module